MKRTLTALVLALALALGGCVGQEVPTPETPQQWVFVSSALLESNYRLTGDLVKSGVIEPSEAEEVKEQLDRMKTQVDTYLKIAIDPDRELSGDQVEVLRNTRSQLLELQRELQRKQAQQ